jgi:outer membrane immunogenic protein
MVERTRGKLQINRKRELLDRRIGMLLRTSLRTAGLGVLLALGTTSAFAQQEVTKVEISGGLSFVRANTADGQCACFSLVGGSSSFVMNSSERLSAVADVSYVHSANINSSGYSLGLMTFMAGPRLSFRGQRFTAFGQVLSGGVHADSPFSSGVGFAGSAGGGVDFRISRRVSWRILQADYLLTRVYNGSNDIQNNIRFTTGVVFRLGNQGPRGPRRPYDRPY